MVKVTVSGSFHRHMSAIYETVGDLRLLGANVLSPADPRVVDYLGEFLFVASDRLRSVRLVQDRHFEAIRASDFLVVVCPDGYTGASTSMEIGHARASGVAVFSTCNVADITVREYVRTVNALDVAVNWAQARATSNAQQHNVLLDPDGSINSLHDELDMLLPQLNGVVGDRDRTAQAALQSARRSMKRVLGD